MEISGFGSVCAREVPKPDKRPSGELQHDQDGRLCSSRWNGAERHSDRQTDSLPVWECLYVSVNFVFCFALFLSYLFGDDVMQNNVY